MKYTKTDAVLSLYPNTGVFDSHQLMRAMLDDFERANGIAVYNQNLKKILTQRKNFKLILLQ